MIIVLIAIIAGVAGIVLESIFYNIEQKAKSK
jgi:hypothetical protein